MFFTPLVLRANQQEVKDDDEATKHNEVDQSGIGASASGFRSVSGRFKQVHDHDSIGFAGM